METAKTIGKQISENVKAERRKRWNGEKILGTVEKKYREKEGLRDVRSALFEERKEKGKRGKWKK